MTKTALCPCRHESIAEASSSVRSLPTGHPLSLKREPDNQFDPFAVQVWAGDKHVGFIKASEVRPLAIRMDALAAKSGEPFVLVNAKLIARSWPLVEIEE